MKTTQFLNKDNALYFIAILLFLIFMGQCSTCNKTSKVNKRMDVIEKQIDSINLYNQLQTEYLIRQMDIKSLEQSKNILYDWNSVVRTTSRPDDLMKSYDVKIKELTEKQLTNEK